MQVTQNKRVEQSYRILDSLRLPNNLYVASFSDVYQFCWIRDSFYMSLVHLNKQNNKFETTYHAILDILKRYKNKLKLHTYQKPVHTYEYIHPRYTIDGYEVMQEWGNAQNDSWAAFLWAIGEATKHNKNIIRDNVDLEIVQMLVDYLNCIEYWHDYDNSLWEEDREIHSSSIGACVASLLNVKHIVSVPDELIQKGLDALNKQLPNESATKDVDAALLSLIYPFKIVNDVMAKQIIKNVEDKLLRQKGCLRYKFDSYFSTLEKEYGRHQSKEFYDGSEMQWTMFIPWLSLCHLTIGNTEKAKEYITKTEELFDERGFLPEGYLANGESCPNNPLGWSHSLYILSNEAIAKLGASY